MQSKKQHFDELYSETIKLSKEGSLSIKSFSTAYYGLQEILNKCVMENRLFKDSMESQFQSRDIGKENMDSILKVDILLQDPPVLNTKGAPKMMKSGIEKASKIKFSSKYKKKKKKGETKF